MKIQVTKEHIARLGKTPICIRRLCNPIIEAVAEQLNMPFPEIFMSDKDIFVRGINFRLSKPAILAMLSVNETGSCEPFEFELDLEGNGLTERKRSGKTKEGEASNAGR